MYVYTQDVDLEQIKSQIPQLPGNISIPEEFANFTVDDFKSVIKSKCSKQSGDEAYENLEVISLLFAKYAHFHFIKPFLSCRKSYQML